MHAIVLSLLLSAGDYIPLKPYYVYSGPKHISGVYNLDPHRANDLIVRMKLCGEDAHCFRYYPMSNKAWKLYEQLGGKRKLVR